MKKKFDMIYYDDRPCSSCGFSFPNLEKCRLTNTLICTGNNKETTIQYPGKHTVHLIVKDNGGLTASKELEEKISIIIVDLVPLLTNYTIQVLSISGKELPKNLISQIVKMYLISIILLYRIKNPTKWLTNIFSLKFIKEVSKKSINFVSIRSTIINAIHDLLASLGIENYLEPIVNIYKFILTKCLEYLSTINNPEEALLRVLHDTFNIKIIKLSSISL